ncbi:MAG: glycosyltransferase [Candidatus Moranbacteria bacterium]|nr:glycosyltransferase [Candidatus Moranbacteria bacterium]
MIIGIDASRAFMKNKTGIGQYAFELLEALINNNGLLLDHQMIVFVKKNQRIPEKFKNKLPGNWKIKKVPSLAFLWSQLALPYSLLQNKLNLLIIPSHALPLIFAFNFCKKLFKDIKKVYVLHGLEIKKIPWAYGFVSKKLNGYLIKNSIKNSDLMICVSQTTKKDAYRFFKFNAKSQVIFQGAKQGKVRIKKIEKKYKKFKNQDYILSIGTLEKRKNIENLILAFQFLKRKNKNLRLLLIGPKGYGYNEIKRRINAFKGDVLELGYVEENAKNYLLKNAKCLACVSWAEGFGRPVLEALKFNVPVVASNIDVFKELFKDKAILCDPNNYLDIAKKIQICLNEKIRKKIVLKNKKKLILIKNKFDWDKIAKKMIKGWTHFDKP